MVVIDLLFVIQSQKKNIFFFGPLLLRLWNYVIYGWHIVLYRNLPLNILENVNNIQQIWNWHFSVSSTLFVVFRFVHVFNIFSGRG